MSDGHHPTATGQVWDPFGAAALWIGYRRCCCCF